MRNGSRPSIGKPASCHARKERAVVIGTDQRITSGPAAIAAAFRGRIHGCTRIVSRKVRFFSLAPRAPSIHGTQRMCGDVRDHGESWRVSGPSAYAFCTAAHGPTETLVTKFAACTRWLPFGDMLECFLDLREDHALDDSSSRRRSDHRHTNEDVKIDTGPLAQDQKGAREIGALPSDDRHHANCAWHLRSS